jgi:hypothetical protein
MRHQNKILCTALTLLAALAPPAVVHAEDDNVNDGKSYPGAMCDSAVSSVASARTGSLYVNTSGASALVNCPVIQDSWLSSTGLAFSQMFFLNPAGQTFTCTQSAYDANGGFLSSRSFTSTTSGLQAKLFVSGVSYLPTTGNFGYIMIQCNVPAGGQIRGYQVQEKA